SERWPMGTATPIYLAANGAATFERPSETEHYEYVSDPAHPVPFIPRPIDMSDPMQWKYWLVQDQRFVSDRPDVAAWKSAPLDKPVHIMGAPEVDLFASTSGTDSDWVVKLIDVYPNDTPEPAAQGAKPSMAGLELPVGIEIFRGRYLTSITCSCRVTGSWCRSSRACFRSTIAIRRRTSRTSCTPSSLTIARR